MAVSAPGGEPDSPLRREISPARTWGHLHKRWAAMLQGDHRVAHQGWPTTHGSD